VSDPGSGSTFSFSLPMSDLAAERPDGRSLVAVPVGAESSAHALGVLDPRTP
jgi:hypothetical protein